MSKNILSVSGMIDLKHIGNLKAKVPVHFADTWATASHRSLRKVIAAFNPGQSKAIGFAMDPDAARKFAQALIESADEVDPQSEAPVAASQASSLTIEQVDGDPKAPPPFKVVASK